MLGVYMCFTTLISVNSPNQLCKLVVPLQILICKTISKTLFTFQGLIQGPIEQKFLVTANSYISQVA